MKKTLELTKLAEKEISRQIPEDGLMMHGWTESTTQFVTAVFTYMKKNATTKLSSLLALC